jgi:hypothetical protein
VTDFPTSSDLTLEVWFRHTNSAALSTDALLSVSSATHTNAILLYLTDPNSPRITIANNTNTSFNAVADFDDCRHCHLVCTWVQSTGAFNLYANGVLLQSSTLSAAAVLNATAVVVVGQDNNGTPGSPSLVAGSHWSGIIQRVAIYPSALSEARIRVHYYEGMAQDLYEMPVTDFVPTNTTGPGDVPAGDAYEILGKDLGLANEALLYTNLVLDSVAGGTVTWRSAQPDSTGTAYPGPGTWGVHTSDYRVTYAS